MKYDGDLFLALAVGVIFGIGAGLYVEHVRIYRNCLNDSAHMTHKDAVTKCDGVVR